VGFFPEDLSDGKRWCIGSDQPRFTTVLGAQQFREAIDCNLVWSGDSLCACTQHQAGLHLIFSLAISSSLGGAVGGNRHFDKLCYGSLGCHEHPRGLAGILFALLAGRFATRTLFIFLIGSAVLPNQQT